MTIKGNNIELCGLIIAQLEGEMTSEQLVRLNHLLKDKEQASLYVEFVSIFSELSCPGVSDFTLQQETESSVSALDDSSRYMELLESLAEDEMKAQAIELPEEESPRELVQKVVYPPREKWKINKFNIITLVTSAAAVFVMGLFLMFAPKSTSVEVATLVDQIDVKWGDSGYGALQTGARLWNNDGPLWLQKGIIKIQFDYGAEVVIEGPAEFKLTDAEKMYLNSGRLYAIVPDGATGFTTVTPSAKIIDLGTEFGVKVDFKGSTDVHMVKGRASLIPGAKDQKEHSRNLVAGRAVRISAENFDVQAISLRQRDFATCIPSPYERYAKSLKPFTYLRFDQSAQGALMDMMKPNGLEGQFKGDISWGDGLDLGEGKSCPTAQFSGTDADGISVELPLMREKNGVTYVAWVCPEVIGEAPVILLDNGRETFREIGLDSEGHFFQCSRRDVREIINPLVSQTVARPGQWYHLAVTNISGQKKRLYVNGRFESLSEVAVGEQIRAEFFSQIYIGQAPDNPFYEGAGRFSGSVCEIIVFDRILSDREVLNLYQSSGIPADQ